MFKNVAASFIVFAFDTTTNAAKTGDAANITAYVSKDYGAVTVLADTTATEMDATNAPGYYLFAAAQGETNGDILMVSGKSATANIAVIGAPAIIYTRPTTGWLAPTTAGRTLDVSAGGEAGIDWANVGSPTTAVGLTGTTISTTQVIATATAVTTVNGLAANVITAASMAADASAEIADAVWDEDATGHQTGGTFGQAIGDPGADTNTIFKAVVTDATGATVGVDVVALKAETVLILEDTGTTLQAEVDGIQADTEDIQARLPAALVSGRIDASVGAMAANVLTAAATAADFGAEVADAVWDEALAGHAGAGSAGEALSAAGTAGDPWTTALPGAYGAGTAGKIIGDNINATISSRASQASVDTIDGIVDDILVDTGTTLDGLITTVDTVVDAIKTKTDSLTFGVAGKVDANIHYVNNVQVTGTGAVGDEWGP